MTLPFMSAHPQSQAWGNISKIASVAQNLITCGPCMSNFKSLACPVGAVGGGGLLKRHTIFKYVAICIECRHVHVMEIRITVSTHLDPLTAVSMVP